MIIDDVTYPLTDKNFIEKSTIKTQIVIGNSFTHNLKYVNGWKKRQGGNYKKTTTFSIDKKGNIYQHFNDIFYSKTFDDINVDENIITITLENVGWLNKDLLKDRHIDWVGNIYKRRAKVIDKRWRGFRYWEPYSNKQFNSCINLVTFLCDKHNINKNCVGHNTFIKNIGDFNGVIYRSNYNKDFTDVSPAWDFKKFKNKIEIK
jgi:N-acetyl-anhydromuramyl-L-alanine amidase AmpD